MKKEVLFGVVVLLLVLSVPAGSIGLNDLDDVAIGVLFDEQHLMYDSVSSNWTNENVTIPDGFVYSNWFNQIVNISSDIFVNKINITINSCIFWDSIQNNLTIISNENISLFTNVGIDSFDIDTNGIMTMRYQPGARVRLESNQLISSFVWTKVSLVVVDFDNNNDFLIISNRFIVPKCGIYQISYSAYVLELTDTDIFGTKIYVNGVGAGGTEYHSMSTGTASDLANSGSDIMKLDKNDYVELFVYQNSGVAKFISSGVHTCYLAIQKIA